MANYYTIFVRHLHGLLMGKLECVLHLILDCLSGVILVLITLMEENTYSAECSVMNFQLIGELIARGNMKNEAQFSMSLSSNAWK